MSSIAFIVVCALFGLFCSFMAVFVNFVWRQKKRTAAPRIEDNRIAEAFCTAVAESLVKSIEKADRDSCNLTEVGFDWALAISLKSYWPDLDTKTAIKLLREYIGVPYGTAGYDWTVSAAREIAAQYVADFGEAA